jgi:hypothetical protein
MNFLNFLDGLRSKCELIFSFLFKIIPWNSLIGVQATIVIILKLLNLKMENFIIKEEHLTYKSKSDKKDYKLLTFLSGFQALLVSTKGLYSDDEVSTNSHLKAGAAITVQVGSFADPVECGGLAHFLEHMVFMGRYYRSITFFKHFFIQSV